MCALSFLAGGTAAGAQPPVEASPLLSAKQLLPPQLLTGPLFRVDDRVPTDGYMASFTLRSDLGTMPVVGVDLLRVRIAELPAIQHLNETSKSQVFLEAMGKAAARPVESAVNIVTNPVETAQSIPAGVGRFFERVSLGAQSIAQAASNPGTSSQEKAQQTAERVGDVTITALGFEQVRRQLAKGLGVDPYTTNPVLAEKLTDTAWVAFSGRLGVNVLVSAFVPGSMAITGVSVTSDLVYDTPKGDLMLVIRKKLITLGAGEAQADAMLKNRWYSLSVLSSLVTDLERLSGVAKRTQAIAVAMTAESEEQARFVAASVRMLSVLNGKGVPLRELAERRTVVGITGDGSIVVPAPVDYLSWTESIARLAARPDLRAPRRGIWLSGGISTLAQRAFSESGWAFHEVK
jgi:hypothetical protein